MVMVIGPLKNKAEAKAEAKKAAAKAEAKVAPTESKESAKADE
jgi:translation initiation factor IF-3